MPDKARNISSGQLVMLLFISRIFALMTYVPKTQASVPGSAALLAVPLSALAAAALILPFLWLSRVCAADPLTCAFRVGRVYGVLCAGLFLLYCLHTAAYSVSHFTFFMTSTVYLDVQPWIFVAFLTAAAAYGAALGLEAFSRMGVLVFLLTAGVLTLLVLALLPELKPVYLLNPLQAGGGAVGRGVLNQLAGNSELILFMLLVWRSPKGRGGTFTKWIVLITAAYLVLTLVLLLALGDYAGTRLFPMYTAAAIAQFSALGRLDLLHIVMWVFAAFLRVTLYLYTANSCLRRIFPKLPNGAGAALCAGAAGVFALLTAESMRYWQAAARPLYTLAPLAVLLLVFPLATGLFPKARGTARGKGDAV